MCIRRPTESACYWHIIRGIPDLNCLQRIYLFSEREKERKRCLNSRGLLRLVFHAEAQLLVGLIQVFASSSYFGSCLAPFASLAQRLSISGFVKKAQFPFKFGDCYRIIEIMVHGLNSQWKDIIYGH